MNTNIAVAVIIVIALTGCIKKPLIKTEYVEVRTAVPTVPQPPKVDKPVYATTVLTEEDRKDIGKVAMAVSITSKQKDGYINILELIINTYKEAADVSEIQSILMVPGLTDKDEAPKP